MGNDTIKAFLFTASIVAAFGGTFKWGGNLYNLLGTGSIVSQFDFYMSIFLAGLCFFLIGKLKNYNEKNEKAIKKVKEEVTEGYTKLINEENAKVAEHVQVTKEMMSEIKKDIKLINANILGLAKEIGKSRK